MNSNKKIVLVRYPRLENVVSLPYPQTKSKIPTKMLIGGMIGIMAMTGSDLPSRVGELTVPQKARFEVKNYFKPTQGQGQELIQIPLQQQLVMNSYSMTKIADMKEEILNLYQIPYSQEAIAKIEEEIAQIEEEIRQYPLLMQQQLLELDYDDLLQEYQEYEGFIQGICTKLEEIDVARMNYEQPIGLTEEEFTYICLNLKDKWGNFLDSQGNLQRNAATFVQSCQQKGVNEILALGIIGLESYWGTSDWVRLYNNFNGNTNSHQKAYSYESQEKGIEVAINTIRNNLIDANGKLKDSMQDINQNYCPVNCPGWSKSVISCMNQIKDSMKIGS